MVRAEREARLRAWAVPVIDAVGLLGCMLLVLQWTPLDVLRTTPATGGDTGSHFWPLWVLREHSIKELALRTWNPGNLAGEPHLLHYFPFPFLVMLLLSFVTGVGAAFNLGTLLPIVLLPAAVYAALRGVGAAFPAPLFAAVASLFALYNEGQSMWGGNTLSLLAGQFAHSYALVGYMAALGALGLELRGGRAPLLSSLALAAVITSHGYVTLGLPLLFMSFLLFYPARTFMLRSKHLAAAGLLALSLCAWFLVPMLENQPWTTPFPVTWRSPELFEELLPPILYPVPLLLVAGTLAAILLRRRLGASTGAPVLAPGVPFWALPLAGFFGFYFVLPGFGLADIRALPQIQLLLAALAGAVTADALRLALRERVWIAALPLAVCGMWWTSLHVEKLPHWMRWNYSGWTEKPLSEELEQLAGALSGSFSDSRVIYEHSVENNRAGSVRVFEMLPYFARRATLESVYLQASVLSPMVYYLQAKVSRTPSCPFSRDPCPRHGILEAEAQLKLMGVSELILVSDESIAQIAESNALEHVGTFGIWKLYRYRERVTLVEAFHRLPQEVRGDWRHEFFEWFQRYDGSQPFLTVAGWPFSPAVTDDEIWRAPPTCRPSVKAAFGRLVLETPCPGHAHVLKFGFHPAWKSRSGEQIFPVSPGFIGIVPHGSRTELTFGEPRWRAFDVFSAVVLCLTAGMLGLRALTALSRRRKPAPGAGKR